MSKGKTHLVLLIFLSLTSLAYAQSKETGAIVGTIVDEQGEALPGVAVTVSSPNLLGERSSVTNAAGEYRFPALPPGVYTIKAALAGFSTAVQENVRLSTTLRLTVDLILRMAQVEEEVTVIAMSPTVDIKSTETASVTLGRDLLANIPFSNFTADIVNLAPGVNNDVAFGSSDSTGISYQMDGVDVSDPEAGSAWVFSDPNIIEEAKVMGIGLPAEYGNFTGVIFNVITKSGGNQFSGMSQFIFQGKKSDSSFWQADNNTDYVNDFPDLTSPLEAITDFAANIGGPIVRDKVWFFLGGQWYRSQTFPTGFPEAQDYKQPRGFLKLTTQATSSTNLSAFLEYDAYNGTNRGGSSTTSPEATVDQKSPDWVGNFSLTQILSDRTFFDIKSSFFRGYYYLDPEVGPDKNAHFDLSANMLKDSAGYFFYADRDRYQVNASLTHYAEDFIQGSHDFKFGVEFEHGKVRNRFGYTGPNALYYVDYFDYGYNGPYLAYQYEGYDSNTRYNRLEEFAQDSWKIGSRFNLSLGIRFTHVWGTVKGVSGSVYTNTRIAPRVGFTLDLLGDKSTILKAHYGQYTEAMLSSYHDRLNPSEAYSDFVSYYWDLDTEEWVEFERIQHEDLYSIDSDIKHPYMNQFVLGIERELFRDASLSATLIYRQWKNIIGPIDTVGQYVPYDVFVADLNQSYQIWEQTEETVGTSKYVLKNIQQGDPWVLDEPYRRYLGFEILFNKRFSNRWQLLASYVYSRATGTIDNGFADDIGWGGSTDSPNFWINADGHSTSDPTHMIKLQGTYILPLGIQFNAHFRAITGNAWTTRYRTGRLNQGRVTFFTEPRGSNHYDMQKILDMRIEKIFTIADRYRIGIMADVFNVFNDNTVSSWGTRIGYDWIPGDYPSTDGHELYGIVRPRQARLGLRFLF